MWIIQDETRTFLSVNEILPLFFIGFFDVEDQRLGHRFFTYGNVDPLNVECFIELFRDNKNHSYPKFLMKSFANKKKVSAAMFKSLLELNTGIRQPAFLVQSETMQYKLSQPITHISRT